MIRHPLVQAGLGLAVGFGGAFAVIQAVDRLGPSEPGDTPVVLGAPDFASYCEQQGESLEPVLVTDDPYGWLCAGTLSGREITVSIDPHVVCRWQFTTRAVATLEEPGDPEGWRCVVEP